MIFKYEMTCHIFSSDKYHRTCEIEMEDRVMKYLTAVMRFCVCVCARMYIYIKTLFQVANYNDGNHQL